MKNKKTILRLIDKKLAEDMQDVQMGLGQMYFEKLVGFIINEARKDNKEKPKRKIKFFGRNH